MYRLKLNKGLSYDTPFVHVTKESPVFETDDIGQKEYLMDTGYFDLIEGYSAEDTGDFCDAADSNETDSSEVKSADPADAFAGMNIDQLKAYAGSHGISISGCTKKTDILSVILRAEENAKVARGIIRSE